MKVYSILGLLITFVSGAAAHPVSSDVLNMHHGSALLVTALVVGTMLVCGIRAARK